MRPAGLGRRLIARLLDGVVLSAPAILLVHAITQSVFETRCVDESFAFERCTQSGSWLGFLGAVWLGLFLLTAVYEVAFLALLGATPGKWVLDLQVLDDRTHRRVNPSRAFARYATLCVTGSVFTVGWWSPLLDRSGRKRGWHDRVAHSAVVRDVA